MARCSRNGARKRAHAASSSPFTGPLDQNVARVFEPAGGDAKSAERDESVAAPIAEPRIAGDDRAARAAFHEIGIGGAVQGRLEGFAARAFGTARHHVKFLGRFEVIKPRIVGREAPHRGLGCEVPMEHSRRGEVLGRVESARGFFAVEEIARPRWLVAVVAIAARDYAGRAVI